MQFLPHTGKHSIILCGNTQHFNSTFILDQIQQSSVTGCTLLLITQHYVTYNMIELLLITYIFVCLFAFLLCIFYDKDHSHWKALTSTAKQWCHIFSLMHR